MDKSNLNYHYDLVRDYAQPSKMMYWGNLILAISLLISAVLQVLNSYKNEYGYLMLGAGILVTIATIIFVIIAINGMKPIGEEGKVSFIKIENGSLVSKSNRFSEIREILLDDLESHDINDKRIILKPKGQNELYITLSQIQNPEKREELVKIIQNVELV